MGGDNRMKHRFLSAAALVFLILSAESPKATALYTYGFENATSGSWVSADGQWSLCQTVTTGTKEYCQTDSTAQLSSASFDGDVTWTDYSVQAEAKIYNYVSGEIGVIGRAQDATHYYQLSLRRDEAGNKKWWIVKNDGGVITVLASGLQYFQSGYYYLLRLRMYKQHLEASISFDKGVSFDSLGFAEDTQYRNGRIGLMTRNTKGTFDNVAVNTPGAPNVQRFGHVVIMSLENQNYGKVIGSPYMPYLNSLVGRAALMTNYYANLHPSQPNYFALTTGQGFYTKEGPIPTGTNNIVRALATRNKTWKGYFTDTTTHEAVFRYFPEVWQNPSQLANIVPIVPNFMNDVGAGALPSVSLIHDLPTVNGHDCAGGGACLGSVDDRLRATIEPYINHPSFVANKDLLVIMFDEAQLDDVTCKGPMTIALTLAAQTRGAWKCGGQAMVMLIGANVKPGYQSTRLYHHEALLRLALEGVGVTESLPGASAFAPDMNDSFGSAAPPPASGGYSEIVLHASRAAATAGSFRIDADAGAAGGAAEHHPDAGAAKAAAPLQSPTNYFDLTFNADAGKAYRLWIRARAEGNYYGNDSVYVQFSQSVTSTGAPLYRLGTTSAVPFVLEDCSGCALSQWGWNDNGYGTGVLGPVIYFEKSGPQTLRVQGREDGIYIDQIVLSAAKYLTTAPGAPRGDATILPRTQ
jgi:hypothetical protein